MNRICLDTSAYSQFKRGHREAVEVVTTSRLVTVPTIVLGELRTGFRLGARARQNESELREFLGRPIVRVLEVDDEAASHYADLVADLRKAGTPVPTNDIWIAALAVREGVVVVTFDEHFSSIRRASHWILAVSDSVE
ncbi:MAG: type II toxin-antitoxin system VapC family toxin [Planctomycetes bacterium]|nr:type II toxin-antitoxin system VapC family toxin [Planctomycetota bacterium]